MPPQPRLVQVAVPAPLRRTFDYLVSGKLPEIGARVRVPFGRQRSVIGVAVGHADEKRDFSGHLKQVVEVLDDEPLIPPPMLGLLKWASDYYHHPLGEVVQAALPVRLRRGLPALAVGETVWRLTLMGKSADASSLKRKPMQLRLLQALKISEQGLTARELGDLSPRWRPAIAAMERLGWLEASQEACLQAEGGSLEEPPSLNDAQQLAVEKVSGARGFCPLLLHGVTGSGKTEVYLRAIQDVLARGAQALVLVPEISLTPQLVERFRRRFPVPIAVLHSGMSEADRACAWLTARAGQAPIVLGTRSAIFTPLLRLGLIVIDEEHDASYKQQDGFRYSARDLALMRAQREDVPIVLGSATPSLESLQQVRTGRYQRLELPDRAGEAALPRLELLDLKRLPLQDGLSPPMRQALSECLARGEQAILFLNRRGYAPVWMCPDCGWIAPCKRCDARLTLHRGSERLRCHHCGAETSVPTVCATCGGNRLRALGEGTERIERALERQFPSARLIRIDRDTTRAKGALETSLEQVRSGKADILVGTQMVSKGHDFPNVTVVGVLNADQGLYSLDFRAAERLFQQLLQVSGRAGRGDKPGRVLIQTYHPEHPLFLALRAHDFAGFADYALAERRDTAYPPFSHLALVRAESPAREAPLRFLHRARQVAQPHLRAGVEIMEPLPSPMERKAGRYRAQILVQAEKRPSLHAFLHAWLPVLEESPESRRVRWSLDVDPIDLY